MLAVPARPEQRDEECGGRKDRTKVGHVSFLFLSGESKTGFLLGEVGVCWATKSALGFLTTLSDWLAADSLPEGYQPFHAGACPPGKVNQKWLMQLPLGSLDVTPEERDLPGSFELPCSLSELHKRGQICGGE